MKKTVLTMCALLTFAVSLTVRAQRGDDAKSAKQYLSENEPRLAETADAGTKLHLLLRLAPAALAACENEKARTYSTELIALGESLQFKIPGFGPSLYSDATHIGNLVLGHLALAGGDLATAREHLLAAGRVPGSSVLKSFGPNMLLAKELLKKGERDTVVQYLDSCDKFWVNERGRLAKWKTTVIQGGEPDFGANLTMGLSNWRFDKRSG